MTSSNELIDVSDILDTLTVIWTSWSKGIGTFYTVLFAPIQDLLDTFLDFFLIPENIGDAIARLSTLIFGSDFTLVGLLYGGLFPVLIVFAFITLIARWVLDIWIL